MRTLIFGGLMLVALMLGVVGCSTAAPGVTNEAGTYVAAMEAKPDQVAKAAEDVCKELKLTIVTANASALDGLVEAKTAQDTSVTIKIQRMTDTQSEVTVRVGVLGDSELSMMILNKIKARL